MKLYYFSGTGNTLYVADRLSEALGVRGESVEMKALVGPFGGVEDEAWKRSFEPNSDCIGLVFPVQEGSVPQHIRNILSKLNLDEVNYIFAVVTHSGFPGEQDVQLQKILEKKGKSLNAFFQIRMMRNSPAEFIPRHTYNQNWPEALDGQWTEKDSWETERMISEATAVISERATTVIPKRGIEKWAAYAKQWAIETIADKNNQKIPFFVDDDCTGCGICEKVCPSGKVIVRERLPLWLSKVNCYHCYACFNYCPTQAILVTGYTKKDGRYRHPAISADIISRQRIRFIQTDVTEKKHDLLSPRHVL